MNISSKSFESCERNCLTESAIKRGLVGDVRSINLVLVVVIGVGALTNSSNLCGASQPYSVGACD
jgi:hypothetical protein